MSVQFKGDSLVDERGNELPVSYEQLRQACVTKPYRTVSVREIIFDAVTSITGEKVVGVYFRETRLFCKLEKEILTDENYQTRKAEIQQQREAYKKPEQPRVCVFSANARRAVINKMKREMKSRRY